jgi:hypothetical protein
MLSMATPDEIRRLEQQLAATQARLDAARPGASPYFWSQGDPVMRAMRERGSPPQSATADARWAAMCREAEQMVASGRSVSAELIITAGQRARGDEPARVVPIGTAYTPERIARGIFKDRK